MQKLYRPGEKGFEEGIHYIVDDGTKGLEPLGVLGPKTIKKGVKLNYYLTRVGFYTVCMASSKPKAKIMRYQFARVYEFALLYVQSLKNKVIQSLPHPNESLKIVKKRIDEKAEELANRTKAGQMKNELKIKDDKINKLEQRIQEMTDEKERQRVITKDLWRHYYDK